MTNIMQTQNPFLTKEMIDYLTSQGYNNTKNVVGATLYKKADKGIFIQGSNIRFRFYDGLTLESSFEDKYFFDGLNNITIEHFKGLLQGLEFTNRQRERHLTIRGKKSDVLEVLKSFAFQTLIIIFFVVSFCSCAYHQDLYKQDGYWTYLNGKYKFHPSGEWQYVLPPANSLDSTKRLQRVKIFNARGNEHINYTIE